MNSDLDNTHDDTINGAVYGALLALTAATLCASLLGRGGRLMAVSMALIIASAKASLIAFYYMGLRRERAFFWLLLGIGLLAVFILLVGIMPDMTYFPR